MLRIQSLPCKNKGDLFDMFLVGQFEISVNQLGLYGALAEMCEECGIFHDRTVTHRCERTICFLVSCQV